MRKEEKREQDKKKKNAIKAKNFIKYSEIAQIEQIGKTEKREGKYNVDYCGEILDREEKKTYNMIIISEFNDNEKELQRKRFYFDYIPNLNMEEEIDVIMQFPNNMKFFKPR